MKFICFGRENFVKLVIDIITIQALLFIFFSSFFSNEIFSYDSEIIVIMCILSFFSLFYYNIHTTLYNIFYLKSIKLREEYINLLVAKKNVELKLYDFNSTFFSQENSLVKSFSYVYFFFKSSYIIQVSFRRIFILYFFKDKLIFLIRQFSIFNKIKNWFFLHILEIKSSIENKIFIYLDQFINNYVNFPFIFLHKYNNIEIFLEKNSKFVTFLGLNIIKN